MTLFISIILLGIIGLLIKLYLTEKRLKEETEDQLQAVLMSFECKKDFELDNLNYQLEQENPQNN